MLLVFYYNLDSLLFKPPQGLHIWRQTDCLSITTNYYNGSTDFFEPEIHNLLSDSNTSGKTAGEFPLLYWFVAMLWKITGKSEALYRIIGLLISLAGLYSVFRTLHQYTGNLIMALFGGLLPFTSPVFVNYTISFLPNTVAVSVAFAGWAFFYRYILGKRNLHLLISVLLFTLSMLLKASAGISLVAISGWLIAEMVFHRKITPITERRYRTILYFTTGAVIIFGWYLYASRYNSIHGGKYTFNSLWPIWELSSGEIRERMEIARTLWKNQLFDHRVLWISLGLWPFLMIFIRRLEPFLRYLLVALPAGTILYMLLWFQGLRDHDYYYIDMVPVILLFWVSAFRLSLTFSRRFSHAVSFVSIIIIVMGAINCRKAIEDRYSGWMNNWYVDNLEAVYETGLMLDTMNIVPNDAIIISIPDPSINSSLYMLNRKGFTDFGSDFSKPGQIDNRIAKGAGFLVINDSSLLKDSLVIPYTVNPVFSHRNVTIYDLSGYIEKDPS